MSKSLVETLIAQGVRIPCPAAVVVEDVDPARIEAGVEIYPGSVVRGMKTLLRSGTRLGRAGGGWFENVRAGRNCDLYSGAFEDCVLRDGVIFRGHAEVRGGTLIEEGCEAAHHVAYKMTILLPHVVAGSLINFCDALVSGGTSRADHSEIGSTLALYNFTPWGDKWASLFGDVPRGVFCRSPRIFIGGQTQIVSPVRVGFGAVLAAGCAVRRDVPAGRLYGEASTGFDEPFDGATLGALAPKFEATRAFIGQLWALRVWYERVRVPVADHPLEAALSVDAIAQIDAGIEERVKRLQKVVDRIPASAAEHARRKLEAEQRGDDAVAERHARRLREHAAVQGAWPAWRSRATTQPAFDPTALDIIARAFVTARSAGPQIELVPWLSRMLEAGAVARGTAALDDVVEAVAGR
jgi:UDP-N-acetylglucosamine/UDP-N-acetylgalactosamine diphosphorylase